MKRKPIILAIFLTLALSLGAWFLFQSKFFSENTFLPNEREIAIEDNAKKEQEFANKPKERDVFEEIRKEREEEKKKQEEEEKKEKEGKKTFAELVAETPSMTLPEVDTADWQTYTDKDWGIEFKYPKDWRVVKATGSFEDSFRIYVETIDERFMGLHDQCECSVHMEIEKENEYQFFMNHPNEFGRYKNAKVYHQKEGLDFFWNEDNNIQTYVKIGSVSILNIRDSFKVAEYPIVRTTFYGIVQTLKTL